MVEPFPSLQLQNERRTDEDGNPGIQLFGRRFFADQSIPELLTELLLVASSTKCIGEEVIGEDCMLPGIDLLTSWPSGCALAYAPKARLNLKLFAFLGASKLDTRHPAHLQHYRDLLGRLSSPEKLAIAGSTEVSDVLRTLENLFMGFQGVGGQRTWCAQAFLPVAVELLGAETIWNQTQAQRDGVSDWDEIIDRFLHFFSVGRHRFLARGGELLYLQLCNALRQDRKEIEAWNEQSRLSFSETERDPSLLRESLVRSLNQTLNACPDTVGKLAEFIDTGVESETSEHTDMEGGERRFTKCGWCPAESWPEGMLFAVELSRLCQAVLDPLECLDLMATACALQVLRSLCAQSARYGRNAGQENPGDLPLGYVWAVSNPETDSSVVKQVSHRSVGGIERMIYDAVRHPSILQVVAAQRQEAETSGKPWKHPMQPYLGPNGADSRYGYKLFRALAKKIGLVMPKLGPGARFVLNEKLLRLLVLTLIRPGQRVRYETFKHLARAHYGLVFDDVGFADACQWCGTNRLTSLGGETDGWVLRMLDAAGMLIRLSDSCSMVRNPFDSGEAER